MVYNLKANGDALPYISKLIYEGYVSKCQQQILGVGELVLSYDFLDSMMWAIVGSAVSLGVMALRLPYKASSDSFEEEGRNLRRGLATTIGISGLYLFITGIAHYFLWPYAAISGGVYNLLFGGAATIGGLVLVGVSAALFLNGGLRAVSYFAVVMGLYLAVDAAAIVNYKLTSNPILSALLYLAPAAAAFLSVPYTHIDNKTMRWLFAIFAFLYGVAWLYFAANVTIGHLKPP